MIDFRLSWLGGRDSVLVATSGASRAQPEDRPSSHERAGNTSERSGWVSGTSSGTGCCRGMNSRTLAPSCFSEAFEAELPYCVAMVRRNL